MYQKTCGVTTIGSCAEPENEKDPIIVKTEINDDFKLKNIDTSGKSLKLFKRDQHIKIGHL